MKKLYILILFFKTSFVIGQTYPFILQQGSLPFGITNTLSIASDKSVIFSGNIMDSISIGINTLNYTGAYISRYDSIGQNLWIQPAGKLTNQGNLPRVIVNNNDNIYVLGKFDDTCHIGNITLIDSGIDNYFIAKLDISGTAVWAKKICNNNNVWMQEMALDYNSNILLTGMLRSTFILDNDTIIPDGNDVLTIKLDDSGNLIWMKKAGGPASGYGEYGAGISTDYAGNVYVTGSLRSINPVFDTIVILSSSISGFKGFLAKYDPTGNVLWAKRCGYQSNFVTSDSAGNAFAGGYFYGNFLYDTTVFSGGTGTVRPFLVKVNSNGSLQWTQFFYSAQGGFVHVAIGNQNNCYVSGGFQDTLKLFGISDTLVLYNDIHSVPNINGFVVCYDSIGNPVWGNVVKGNGGQMGTSDIDYRNCQLAFIGNFDSTCHVAYYNNDSIINAGNYDGFIIIDDGCNVLSSFNEISLPSEGEVYCFPNPFNDILKIVCGRETVSQIILYDVYSRKVFQKDFVISTSINTEQLAKGIYLYEVRNKNGVIKKGKVVKD